jgi:dCMP deaminase
MKDQHQFYMAFAEQASKASYCDRNKVGAILVKDHNIISFGYNGTPHGFDNSCEHIVTGGALETKSEVLHAESNTITKCAQSTGNSKGSTLYVTVAPCFDCAKLIIQAGIIKVFYKYPYRLPEGLALLYQAKIKTYQI